LNILRMPKATRSKTRAHTQSAKLAHRFNNITADQGVEKVDVGSKADVSVPEILHSMTPVVTPQLTKKEKHKMKHELFMERFQSLHSPYSKSHNRKLKQKAKQQLTANLTDLETALNEIDKDVPGRIPSRIKDYSSTSSRRDGLKPIQIREGKGAPLTKAERRQTFRIESKRATAVQANQEYSTNPFEIIRRYAQNNLVPPTTPKAES